MNFKLKAVEIVYIFLLLVNINYMIFFGPHLLQHIGSYLSHVLLLSHLFSNNQPSLPPKTQLERKEQVRKGVS